MADVHYEYSLTEGGTLLRASFEDAELEDYTGHEEYSPKVGKWVECHLPAGEFFDSRAIPPEEAQAIIANPAYAKELRRKVFNLPPEHGASTRKRDRRVSWLRRYMPTTDIEKARQLFQEAGLAFPTIPDGLAARLKEQGKWLFSTRAIQMSPYNLQHYVHEVDGTHMDDYAVLSHSGHGMNSYAIQYYLVFGPLRMFLHLGWGGAYMDADVDAAKIRECFSLADQIVPATMPVGKVSDRLTIVGSDFYGSYWATPSQSLQKKPRGSKGPAEVLAEVLHWLTRP